MWAQHTNGNDVIAGGSDRSFLAGQGIAPGAAVTLVGVGADGTVLVASVAGHVRISAEMAAAVMVVTSVILVACSFKPATGTDHVFVHTAAFHVQNA